MKPKRNWGGCSVGTAYDMEFLSMPLRWPQVAWSSVQWFQYYYNLRGNNVSITSHSSAVGMVTGYGLDIRGVTVWVPVESRIFSSGVHPTSYSMGSGGFLPWGKVTGPEAEHSPPTSAKVKKIWIYTSIPPYAFMV
jgi:hypothetical protein